ncbi:hypothetical patatin-like protein [Gordonia spumicola]|uniref:Hypothetical patatin-like protein n=1 Tax=Gordonia spumicola TaxID=589161 RepID=A0A7I9V5V1_9ACTN|nr:patatin-like phospholipase family protein [Gordonia spumicola]GEE00805.1 hypothetical patatin-like protein [Gordonia spumicola]
MATTTAFVLAGGANLGAVQVGMMQALRERGVVPDMLIGTSAGALNASFISGHGFTGQALDDLGDVWRGLTAWELFPPSVRQVVNALRGRKPSMFDDSGMRALVERHLTFDRLENAPIDLTVIATDLLTGDEAALSAGPAIDAVLASSAIPGLLPPVSWNGRSLVDGGVSDNTALAPAVERGADIVYVLPCGQPCSAETTPDNVAEILLHTMALLIHRRLVSDIREYSDDAELIVVPPPCPIAVGALDFGRADDLIVEAYRTAGPFLDVDGGRRKAPADYVDVPSS